MLIFNNTERWCKLESYDLSRTLLRYHTGQFHVQRSRLR